MTPGLRDLALEAIHEIDERGIEYCLLRNFEFLDGGDIEGDVDVLVSEECRQSLDTVLSELGFRRGRGDTSRQTTYLRFHPPSRRLLVLDVYWGTPTYNGVPLLDGDRTLRRVRRHQGIAVPSEEDLFVELLFHGALNKNRYRSEYRDRLRQLRQVVDDEDVLDHARQVFGRIGTAAASAALDGDLERPLRLKWPLVAAGVLRRPSLASRLVWNLLLWREVVLPLRRAIRTYDPRAPAAVIALLGPDGAGKTTVSERVATVLEDAGFEVTVAPLGTYNDRSWPFAVASRVTDTLGGLNGLWGTGSGADPDGRDRAARAGGDTKRIEKPGGDGESTETLPPKKPPWKALVHVADIAARYLQAKIGSRGVVVADRFVHDVVAYDDFNSPPQSLFRTFEPECFTGIVLVGDPETLGDRSEYDVESIERMLTDFEQLDLEPVDATRDVEAVVTDVLEIVFSDPAILEHSEYVR